MSSLPEYCVGCRRELVITDINTLVHLRFSELNIPPVNI